MYEITLVDFALSKHPGFDFSALKSELLFLIGRLAKQNSFQIAKNMVLVLHKVLTAKNETEIEEWGAEFKSAELLSHLKNLYSIASQDVSRVALIEVQAMFSGRCIELAADYVSSVSKNLIFSSGTASESRENDRALKAKKQYEQVSDFCSKYRIYA